MATDISVGVIYRKFITNFDSIPFEARIDEDLIGAILELQNHENSSFVNDIDYWSELSRITNNLKYFSDKYNFDFTDAEYFGVEYFPEGTEIYIEEDCFLNSYGEHQESELVKIYNPKRKPTTYIL